MKSPHVGIENAQIVNKWSKTGLLRGLSGRLREMLARKLEREGVVIILKVKR